MKSELNKLFSGFEKEVSLISLIIPVFNEEHNLLILGKTLAKVSWPVPCEWIFIDDASQDNSFEVIQGLRVDNVRIRFFRNESNQGKSVCLTKGIAMARGDIIAIQDADLEYDPNDLLTLIEPIMENKADVVYGSRFRKDAKQVHRTFHRYANEFLSLVSNLFSGIFLTDMESCYKVFRADILKSFHIRTRRFGFEPEVTAYLAKFSLRILEFPIYYFPRTYLEGKKIGWKDGVAALWFIFKYNFLVSAKKCLKKEVLEQWNREKTVKEGIPKQEYKSHQTKA